MGELANVQSERIIPDQRPNPSFTVGIRRASPSQPFLGIWILILEAKNGLKFYFLVSGRLFMSTF